MLPMASLDHLSIPRSFKPTFLPSTQLSSIQDMIAILQEELCAEREAMNSFLQLRHEQLLSQFRYKDIAESTSRVVHLGEESARQVPLRQSLDKIISLGEESSGQACPRQSLHEFLPDSVAVVQEDFFRHACSTRNGHRGSRRQSELLPSFNGDQHSHDLHAHPACLLEGFDSETSKDNHRTPLSTHSQFLTFDPDNAPKDDHRAQSSTHSRLSTYSKPSESPSLPSVLCSRGTHIDLDKVEASTSSGKSQKPKKSKIRKIRSESTVGRADFTNFGRLQQYLSRTARSEVFELFFAVLITLNALVMCVEAQYWGFESGYVLGYRGMTKPASDVWVHAYTVFKVLDVMFGVAFTFEVLIKAVGLRLDFVWSGWNWFDTVIIASWLLHTFFESILPVDPFTLRVARLARLVRILRLVKTLQVFDILHLMAASLKASVYVLLWSVVLLLGIMMSASLVMVSLIDFYVSSESTPENKKHEAFSYFGTFSRAFLSVFELTLGNWVPITRFLHDDVSDWFGLAFMTYYCIVSFAVVMVIRGVFLHETFQAAGESDELMILRQGRYKKKTIEKMHALFSEADESGDGYLNRREFINVMNDPRVKMWLEAMGLEVRDTEHVFEVMQSGDNRITATEFASGFVRLRGSARSIDMVQVLRLSRAMATLLQDVGSVLGCELKRSFAV